MPDATSTPAPAPHSRTGEIVRYLASGATAATSTFASRFLFNQWMSFEWAVTLAYLVGMAVGFTLMRRYAFRPSNRPLSSQVMGYCLVNLVGLVQNVGFSSLMLRVVFPRYVDDPEALTPLAHIIGIGIPTISSYFGHKWVTFRR